MADEDWSYRVMILERIEGDRTDDHDDMFSVNFAVAGPNASAEVEIFVTDVEDEANILSLAMHALHIAMLTWGRVTAERRIAQPQGKPN